VAKGLFIRQDGAVMVEYGSRQIPMTKAVYKANGYTPPVQKLLSVQTPNSNGTSRGALWPAKST
jgi:hypothetical protein